MKTEIQTGKERRVDDMVKNRKILALSAVLVMVTTSSVPVGALTLNQGSNDGNTEVVAHIEDEQTGAVQYIVTVPDKVDFGILTQPETDTDSFKDVPFKVELTSVENLAKDQYVIVRMKDQNATEEDSQFYLTQKDSPNTKFIYDVYNIYPIEEYYQPLAATAMSEPNGYFLVAFDQVGEKCEGTLRFNQKQLYGKELSEIAGDYSGTVVFTTSILQF